MKTYLHTPIYQKSAEILDTLKAITDLFPEDNRSLQFMKEQILGDAMLIQAKLVGAFSTPLYDIKMENATFIRKACRDLTASYHSLEMFDFEDVNYYQIVQELLEEFRFLFIDWVANFNPKHFITDSWGLFNPPGISHDYEQSDEELKFLDEDDD